MAELIASSNTAETSADFTLADGESVTIWLTSDPTQSRQRVEVHIVDGADSRIIGEITEAERGVRVLQAIGTFRVHRPAQAAAFAVHLEQAA